MAQKSNMRKNGRKGILSFLSVLLLWALANTGCQSPSAKMAIQSIDSLITSIDDLDARLREIPKDSFQAYVRQSKSLNRFFSEVSPKTNLRPFLLEIENMGMAQKSISKFLGKIPEFQSGLSQSSVQLLGLKSDIEKNMYPDSLLQNYLQEEQEILQVLGTKIQSELLFVNGQAERYLQVRPFLTHIQDSLQQIHGLGP